MPEPTDGRSERMGGVAVPAAPGTPSAQARLNSRTWAEGDHLAAYANLQLTPAEVRIFLEHRDLLSGRVLDLGCGGGRLLYYLLMLSDEVHGLDLSPRMVEYCRQHFPAADVRLGDLNSVRSHVDGSFDAVLASDNLIDVFDDAERRRVMTALRELIAPGGALIFSTHDLAYLDTNPDYLTSDPAFPRMGLARLLLDTSPADLYRRTRNRARASRNRRRLGQLEQRHPDHAIVNDHPHHYGFLHYYIRRDDQERQLEQLGFELLECVASDGTPVEPGGTGPTDSLYYVARPK